MDASRSLLHSTTIRWQAATGLVAQLTQGAASVAIILVVRSHIGSLELAGAVVAALWLGAGIARPLQGRFIDRRGSGSLLAVCGIAHFAALAGIDVASRLQSPGWLIVLFGAVAGFALPPISTVMRTRWPLLLRADERAACYSLVYLTQELAILAGPLLFAALTAVFSPSVALAAIAAATGVGTIAFAMADSASENIHPRSDLMVATPLRVRGFQVVLVVAVLVGGVLGSMQVGAATLASARGAPAVAGLLIAALSVGGIVGAALYGTGRWNATPWWRLVVLLALLAFVLAVMATVGTLFLVAGLAVLAGMALNPVLSTFSLLTDQQVSANRAGEAFGWLSLATAAGTGGGVSFAAVIAHVHHGPRTAFATAAVAGTVAGTVTLLSGPTLGQLTRQEKGRG